MSLLLLLRNHQSGDTPTVIPYITVGAPLLRQRRRSRGHLTGSSNLTATGHISFDSLADDDELLTLI